MAKSTKGMGGSVAGIGCLLFFAIFWSGLTLAFDFILVKAIFQQIQALNYSTAIGTITSSEVEANSDGEGTTYRPIIKYTYVVNNKRYEGDRYRYGQMGSGDHSAHRIVASYPVGKKVEVYHAPNNPADAVLHAGLEGADLFLMMFMLPFNLVMLGLWIAILSGMRYRMFRPVAGGAKVFDEGRCLRLRLSPMRPTYIGAAVCGGLAFALVFIVGFGFGFNPPLQAMFLAWGIILGGGIIAGFHAYRKLVKGDSDLVIDDFRGTVTLPRTFNRQEEVVVPSEKIISIEIEEVEKRDSEGGTQRSYVPTVVFTDENGSQRREKLIEWRDEASAKGLVEWLRERLRLKPSSDAGGSGESRAVD
jgi:hypothetical protein